MLRETTSRGLCGLVCPSRTSERGGEGDCVCLLLQDLVQSCLRGVSCVITAKPITKLFVCVVCVYYCRTYYKAVCGGGGGQ